MQWVMYVEVQGLYAFAARQAGLAPADQPVVILREGRVYDGCREAFAGGLTLGAPARQALRDAPRAVQIDFAEVEAAPVARMFWDRCLERTPYIEPGAELHQVYLALPTPGKGLTAALRAEVNQLAAAGTAYGFVAFSGVAPSKLVARAAALACKEGWLLWRPGMSRAAPPETTKLVPLGEEERFLAPLPISFLPVAKDVARRLTRLGLRSIGEAARIPEGEWLRQLGAAGRQVGLWSRGFDNEPVKPCYPSRLLEHRIAFSPEVRERDLLEQSLHRAGAALSRRLEASGEGCQQVELTLERSGSPPVTVTRTLARLQQTPYPIRQALITLLADALTRAEAAEPGTGPPGWDGAVFALTARLGLIGPMPWQQMDLWDDGGRSEREERLERALALLQERFPSRMVGLGPRQNLSWREQMLCFNDPYRAGFSAADLPDGGPVH